MIIDLNLYKNSFLADLLFLQSSKCILVVALKRKKENRMTWLADGDATSHLTNDSHVHASLSFPVHLEAF